MFKILVLAIGFALSTNLAAQNIFAVQNNQKIWEAKDRHDLVYTDLILNKGKDSQKITALKGLLSWHDTGLRAPILEQLKSKNAEVCRSAIEAMGQSRDSFYIPFLINFIEHSSNLNLQKTSLQALGKCITKSKVHELTERNYHKLSGFAECVYRAMLKGVGHKSLTSKMIDLWKAENLESQFYAAWYLARTPHRLDSQSIKLIDLNGLNQWPSDIGIPLIMAIGRANMAAKDSQSVYPLILNYINSMPKLADQSECLKAISIYKVLSYYKPITDSSQYQIITNRAGVIYPALQLAHSELLAKSCATIQTLPTFTYNPAKVNLLKLADCNALPLVLNPSNPTYDIIWQMQVMENDFTKFQIIRRVLLDNPEPAVKSAAIEALIKCRNSIAYQDEPLGSFEELLFTVLKTGDEGVLSIIANAILDKQITVSAKVSNQLIEMQASLELPQEMEAFIDIAKVKAMVSNTVYKKPEPVWNHPIDWDYVSNIKDNQKIKVTTNAGEFIIQMNVNEAPASVAAILKLVDEGFYNGKYFHRMVPNFVLQGGCPRGDGFGSRDYTLRSEFSNLKYATGAVGLASAGQDTESCQWFVTHCPTPHLDGRYTIIGQVVSGMETVHLLGVGDKMVKVERIH